MTLHSPRRLLSRHRGYVLLVTLVLVAVAAVATLAAAQRSLQRATQAARTRRLLQERYGVLSLQRSVLPVAEDVLAEDEKRNGRPSVSCRRALTLGEVRFELIVSDEQAKASVPILLVGRTPPDAESKLREILEGSVPSVHIHLRPCAADSGLPPVGSLGQIFDLSPGQLLRTTWGVSPADAVTCWSDGRLNVRRASAVSLKGIACPPLDLGSVDKLTSLRGQTPALSLPQLLDALDVLAQGRQAAEAKLVDGSACHSLWVITPRSNAGSAADGEADPANYDLFIRQESGAHPRILSFRW